MSLQPGELLCRVCLQQDELLVDIFETVEELQVDLCTLLETCGNIKVNHTDAYPKYLCQECTNELLIAAKFRKKCAEAEKRLRDETSRVNMDTAELVVAEEIIIFDPNDYKVESSSPREDCVEELTEVLSSNCRHCGAVFQLPAALRRHIERVHTSVTIYDCEKCGGFFTELHSYQSHKCPASGFQKGEHSCSECGKCLQSASSLAVHMHLHSNERPFTCDLCPKTFRTNGALVAHQRRHQQLLQYKCPHCGRGFVESSNLRRHITARHTDERPHPCTICQRSFSRVYLLQLHLRTHTGERPYACDHCDKRFAQLGVLRSHERIHTGERLHRCQVCEKTFTRAGQLRKHEMRHETGS
ncbi:zinc finger protein 239 isoform X1 [Drosophila subpulchrella]|uniref:zinc finger protein 239 isoform X1 n=1 Tax=Drosophila subpulchrella TaxID=1486046 RepID=UPI0018A177C6|nr:zinc finger protein 239 isoform X1 [Drosophila subpulchrella]XP_037730432.1 zinc finger protein 239 isoform X1 [Drosophila subpulchrella]